MTRGMPCPQSFAPPGESCVAEKKSAQRWPKLPCGTWPMRVSLNTQRAWERMKVEVPHADMIERLTGHDLLTTSDSLNDIDAGSDTTPACGRRSCCAPEASANATAPRGSSPRPGRYLGAHHILAFSQDGQDRRTNVMALCADVRL